MCTHISAKTKICQSLCNSSANGSVPIWHLCLMLCLTCVVSAEQISQVISRAECYLYLSLSSRSLLSHLKLVVSRPSSDLILQLLSSLIPPVQVLFFLNTSLLQPSLCTCQLSVNLLFLVLSISPFLALWPFLPASHLLKTPLLFHVPLTFTAFTWDNFQSRKLFTLMQLICAAKSETWLFLQKTWRRLNTL